MYKTHSHCPPVIPTLMAAMLLVACGVGPKENQRLASTPTTNEGGDEIHVTTSSPEALAAFDAGWRALDVGRPQQARSFFAAAIRDDPEFVLAHLGLAQSATSPTEFQKHLAAARRHLDAANPGEGLMLEIYQTFMTNDAERRVDAAQRLVDAYPASPRAWVMLGSMRGGLNRSEAARQAFDKALELAPEMLGAHFGLWMSYLFSDPKSFDRALAAMERCLEINPDEPKCHEGAGDVYRARGEFDRAREAYAQATRLDPQIAVAQLKKGHVHAFLGEFEAAREAYDAGVASSSGIYRQIYANYRAFTHLHRDDPLAALKELGEIVATANEHGLSEGGLSEGGLSEGEIARVLQTTRENMATIALHHQILDRAEEILVADAVSRRAQAARLGEVDFTRLQEATILFWESRLAARKGDLTTARAKAAEHRGLIENDDNPRRFEAYHGAMGLIEWLDSEPQRAIEHLRQANLTSMLVKYHLAVAHEDAGHADEARKLFREVGEWNFNSVGYALVRRDALRRATAG